MGSLWKECDDAIELLKCDHRQVKELHKQFEEAAAPDKVALAQAICQALTVHAQLEEQVFYPALRGKVSNDLLDEAVVEHSTLKALIEQLDGARETDDLFNARMTVLMEYVKHHVKEEEHEIMPQAQAVGVDLVACGKELKALKAKLEAELPPLGKGVGETVAVPTIEARDTAAARGSSARH